MSGRQYGVGFTRAELIMAVVVLMLIVLIFGGMLIPAVPREKAKAPRIKCVNNLKNVALAFRIFATDHDGKFHGVLLASNVTDLSSIRIEDVFGAVTNELLPQVLHCPADRERKAAVSFGGFSLENISYFTSLTSDETRPQSFLAGDRNVLVDGKLASRLLPLTTNVVLSWSKEMHDEQGDVAMGDGSVQQMSSRRLRESVRDALDGVATDYLVFPQ